MAIKIHTFESKDPLVGRSHWWGAPDLPPDMPYPYVELEDGYPEPLTFICQIRLEELADSDPENVLPHKGMLYFFAPIDYYLGELDSPLDYHTPPVVLYRPDIEQCEPLSPYVLCWEDSNESIFRPSLGISFERVCDTPHDGNLLLANPLQDEIREAHPGEICLLQIDENDDWGLRFYDCGSYYIYTNAEALQRQDFSEVKGDLFFY